MKIERIEPMLAATADKDLIKQLYKDPNWIAEEKFDGERYMLHLGNEGNKLYSRNISSVTNQPIDRAANVPHLTSKIYPDLDGTVIDGEILAPVGNFSKVSSIMGSLPDKGIAYQKANGNAVYRVFDICYYRGQDVMNLTLVERRAILELVVNLLNVPEITIVKQQANNTEQYYKDIVNANGEGIILKHIQSKYIPNGRSKDDWIKVKQVATWDVVIMSYTDPEQFTENSKGEQTVNRFFVKGWISAIEFGVYKEDKLIKVGQCTGMSDAIRKEISENKNKYIGKVLEVKGQPILKDAIRHPRFVKVREDLNPTQCTYKKFIEQRGE